MCAAASTLATSQRKRIQTPSWFNEFTYLDSELGWSIMRNTVTVQVLDNLSVVVPRLSDHIFYGPNSAIVKKDKDLFRQMVLAQTSKFQPAGHLSSLASEVTADCFEEIKKPLQKDNSWHMAQFDKIFKHKDGDKKKSIELRISEIYRYKTNDLVHGTLRINQGILSKMLKSSKPPKIIYIVQTSFIAESVKMLLKINQTMKFFEQKNVVIAFDMVQYDLLDDGTLQNPFPYWKPKLNKLDCWTSAWYVDWPDEFPDPIIYICDLLPRATNKINADVRLVSNEAKKVDDAKQDEAQKVTEDDEKQADTEQRDAEHEDVKQDEEAEGGSHIEISF